MGYSCPVCGDPQADGRHLADHLAVTAMVHGDDHEAWLDDRVPDWEGMTPGELGPEVAEHAPETDYPQVFEDTTGDHAGHGDHADRGETLEDHLSRAGRRGPGRGELTADRREVLDEARAMTEEMLADDGEGDDGEGGDDEDADTGERGTDDS